MNKVKNLGQVYTPPNVVEFMMSLSKNDGNILEPSAGEGAFSNYIKENIDRELVSIEFDPDNFRDDFIIMDFFEYSTDNKFPTIVGNPPYVSFKNIVDSTYNLIRSTNYLSGYDNRTNLYIHFIRKCVEHLEDGGEMILITPREFIKATSAIRLNNFLFENGTITDWYEYGDEVVFKGYSPTVVVWRYEKGNFCRNTKTNSGNRKFNLNDGQITFSAEDNNFKFNDLFFVKVGAVSGADNLFVSPNGNVDFVCSYTKKNNELKKMFFNVFHNDLLVHKEKLMERKMKKFNDDNWWHWGRGLYESDAERIYVNCKTRDTKPFFTNSCKYYDGSVLAIFPKTKIDINLAIDMLNSVNWDDLGFKVGGRLCFTQKSLENVNLPSNFEILKT